MKTYLINLDDDQERLVFADSQMRRLGVEYVRESAFNARTKSANELRQYVNRFRWELAVGRPVRPGEVGCAMSHYAIYKRLSSSQTSSCVCVLEDDVILDDNFNKVISYVENNIDCNTPTVVLLSNHTDQKLTTQSGGIVLAKCSRDMYTEGYIITSAAAKALLKANMPLQVPCDDWGRWASRGIINLYHVYPTVCNQDQNQFESRTVNPGAFNVNKLNLPRFFAHKCKRVIEKTLDRILPL